MIDRLLFEFEYISRKLIINEVAIHDITILGPAWVNSFTIGIIFFLLLILKFKAKRDSSGKTMCILLVENRLVKTLFRLSEWQTLLKLFLKHRIWFIIACKKPSWPWVYFSMSFIHARFFSINDHVWLHDETILDSLYFCLAAISDIYRLTNFWLNRFIFLGSQVKTRYFHDYNYYSPQYLQAMKNNLELFRECMK